MAKLSDADLIAAMPTVVTELAIRLPSHWLTAVADRAFGGTPADRQRFLYAAAHMTTPEEKRIAAEAVTEGLRCRVDQLRAQCRDLEGQVAQNAATINAMTSPPAPRPPCQVIELDTYRVPCG